MKLFFENKMNEGYYGNIFQGPGDYDIYVFKASLDDNDNDVYSDSYVYKSGYYKSENELIAAIKKIDQKQVRDYVINFDHTEKQHDLSIEEVLSKISSGSVLTINDKNKSAWINADEYNITYDVAKEFVNKYGNKLEELKFGDDRDNLFPYQHTYSWYRWYR